MPLNPADWQGDAYGNYSGPRWSYHNARPPQDMYGQPDDVVDWWKRNVYDNAALSDPQGYAQKLISDWRAEAARRGITVDATDSEIVAYVARGYFPVPQAQVDAYAQQIYAAARANPDAIPTTLKNDGEVTADDAALRNYLQSQGINTDLPQTQFFSSALTAPIPGSAVFSGTANLPDARYSGPSSASAYTVTSSAPPLAVNQGAPIASSPGLLGLIGGEGGGGNKWVLIAAAVAGYYLLTKGKS